MGRVFVVEDVTLNRTVVVKLVTPELESGMSVERFVREIQLTARLQHPHIVPVLTTGARDGLVWYAMPFIRGESLRARMKQDGALSVDDTVSILRDVLDALSFAHKEGIVHRDIKPENILLQADHAVVVDFGVSKALTEATDEASLTRSGVTLGTPAYMAPEQIAAEKNVDHRADIYAVGVVGYEMLTGLSPFAGASPQAVIAAHMTKTPERLSAKSETVPARLDALVMRALEKDPDKRWQSAREMRDEMDSLRESSAKTAKSWPRYVAAATIVAVLAFTALSLQRRFSLGSGRSSGEVGVVDSAKSVAVLPFVNMSGSADNEYFSDGMTEELINTLTKIGGLRVAARTSSFAFKGKVQDIRQIAQALGVANVVEGSVRRAGNRLRVTAQLVNAGSGYHLWSDTFDGDVTDVFAVQDSISRSIATMLAGHLLATSGASQARASNARAYDFYLRGRFFFHQGAKKMELEKAMAMFDSAVAIDPTFALAYTGIADAYSYLADDFLPPHVAYPKSQAAAIRALELDPSLSEAHAALALVHLGYTWNWPALKREAELALLQNPNSSIAHSLMAQYWSLVRDTSRTVAEVQKAVGLDPVSILILLDGARVTGYVGQHGLSQRLRQRAVEIDSTKAALYATVEAMFLLSGGDTARAVRLMERAEVQHPNCCPEMRANFYANARRADKARGYLRMLELRKQTSYKRADMIARVYSSLGDTDIAFKWLDIAFAERSASLPWVLRDHEFDSVHGDPRYTKLLDQLGFEASGELKKGS